MSYEPTVDRLEETIARSLGIDRATVTDELAYQSIPEWGSLNHVTLMVSLAKDFGIGENATDVRHLTSVAAIKRRLGLLKKSDESTYPINTASSDSRMVRVDRGLEHTVLDTTKITEVGTGGRGPIYRGHDSLELFRRNSLEEVGTLLIDGVLEGLSTDARALIASGKSMAMDVNMARATPSTHETVRFAQSLSSINIGFARSGGEDPIDSLRREGWALLGAASQSIGEAQSAPDLETTHPIIDSILDGVDLRVPRPLAAEALSKIMILQADNGASASTLALRVAISAGASLQEAMMAAIVTFGGPLHGGALKSIVEFLEERSPDNVRRDAEHMISSGEPVPGFGHRIYRAGDPRTAPMERLFHRLADETGDHEYAGKLQALRSVMRRREVFGAAANYDPYAGPAWRLMGFDRSHLIPLFSTARMIGWIAHAMEQFQSNTLIRPRLLYVGELPQRAGQESQ